MQFPAATTPPFSGGADHSVPLKNLAILQTQMDSLHKFLSDSVNTNTLLGQPQMNMVSSQISSAIHQIIVNGAALLSSTSSFPYPDPDPDPKQVEVEDGSDVIELDAVELLAEHVHFCEICGKGFKRDANLRMHMRAHGNQFKTPEALSKPDKLVVRSRSRRFSCPYVGCNRNKKHEKFRSLKSVICVKNHFKRSHCPKMYACNRCHKKSFSVLADLKSHLKHCGVESKWMCSCGTSFSRKDKLFRHMALFEGHMPALENMGINKNNDSSNDGLLEGLLDGYGSVEKYCFEDNSVNTTTTTTAGGCGMMDEFFNFSSS